MHLSQFVTKEDVENEAKAVDKLGDELPSVNIVRVFRHGWLISSRDSIFTNANSMGILGATTTPTTSFGRRIK
jgi:hypothetical protein